MLGRMFLLAIGMVLGFAAALIGGIVIAVGRDVGVGAVVAGLGAPVAGLCLVQLLRLNRKYQADALAAVLADPAEIVARWASAAGEVILARRGLFVGPSFYPFAAGYQRLVHASLDARELVLEFDNVGAEGTLRRTVSVPEEAVAAVAGFVTRRSAGA